MIVTITGLSGVGKTTLANCLEERGLQRIVTYTSRAPRAGEVHGIHYMFCKRSQLEELYNGGELWEVSEFCGNLYGSPEIKLDSNYCIVLDSSGAMRYKEHYGAECFTVLLTASEGERLKRRLYRQQRDGVITNRRDEVAPLIENFDAVIDTTGIHPSVVADFVLDRMYKLVRQR